MDQQTLRVLEFGDVLEAAASLGSTPLGATRVLGLRPIQEIERRGLELDRVAEVAAFIKVEGDLDLSGLHDLSRFGPRLAKPGAMLLPEDLELFRQTLDCLARIRRRLSSAERYPLLKDLTRPLQDYSQLGQELARAFGPGLTVADGASRRLKELRRRRGSLKEEIRTRLEEILDEQRGRGLIQEELITQRNDRFVVPVKSGRQGELEGVIHDASATRRTVYLEPLAVTGLNNQLGLLAGEERREIERILKRLTGLVAAIWPDLEGQIDVLAELDGLQARARLAERLKAVRPELDQSGRLELREARHPLLCLSGREVIPVDLVFPQDKRTLIISGPNAGGKTVALKTLGLLCLMAASGFLIPAAEGSRLPLLKNLAATIGDDQDLSEGASTYSARLKRLKDILAAAGPGWLVLIDELGAGTDPAEGSALGLAVLDRLSRQGARSLATTHLNLIKAWAATRPEALNLSVDFDPASRRPTYRLIYGQPGLSNAFETAAQVGLGPEVLAGARDYLGGEEERFKSLLEDLTRLAEGQRRGLAAVEAERRDLAEARRLAGEAGRRFEAERRELLEREGLRLRETLERAEAELAGILEQARSREQKERERARYRFFEEKGRLKRALRPGEFWPGPVRPLPAGQPVRVAGLKRPGELLEPMEAGRPVEVRLAGGVRLKVDPARVSPAEARDDRRPRERLAPGPSREAFRPEVKIIGLRVEEALPVIDKALDEAVLAGLERLAIVHGVGTGALRRAVREFLAGHPQVKNFYSPEGVAGAAVTEVELGG